MTNKCENRVKIENAIIDANVDGCDNLTFTYTDKSKSGWRIKFVTLNPSIEEIVRIRKQLRKQFPDNDFRIWYVEEYTNYRGLAIKIFNN